MIFAALLGIAAILCYIAYTLDGIRLGVHHGNEQRRRLMATAKELADAVKAFRDAVVPQLDAAVEDIARIHDLLDAATGNGADIPGAMAALDELTAKFTTLKDQVDRPEGEEPPPTP